MKRYDDFKEFYSEELFAELVILDNIRRAMLIKCVCATIVLAVAIGLVSLSLLTGTIESVYIVLIIWMLCVAFWCYAVWLITRDYRANFKSMIISPLVKFIDSNLQYVPEGSIGLNTFRRAEMFERYVNEFDGEDLICGTIDKTEIQFSEVNAQYREENEDSLLSSMMKDENGEGNLLDKYKHNVFKGLFFVADFHKTFYGKILVLPDKAEKYFGRFGSMLQSHNFVRGELMKMDNAEFEKHFAVYGTDQIQTRYVLTPQIMEKILKLKKKTGAALYLSFKDSMLYIAVPCKQNKFEPPYFKSLVNYIDAYQYFQDLTIFIGIVEEFNLNTRIWTKE